MSHIKSMSREYGNCTWCMSYLELNCSRVHVSVCVSVGGKTTGWCFLCVHHLLHFSSVFTFYKIISTISMAGIFSLKENQKYTIFFAVSGNFKFFFINRIFYFIIFSFGDCHREFFFEAFNLKWILSNLNDNINGTTCV